MKNFNALFYPEMVCLNEGMLKYLLLMYDKIYFLPTDTFLNPGCTSIATRYSVLDSLLSVVFGNPKDAYNFLLYASERNIWDDKLKRLIDMYEQLEEQKICIPFQDEEFVTAVRSHPLKAAVDSDIVDIEFQSYCKQHMNIKTSVPDLPEGAEFKGGGGGIPILAYPLELRSFALCSERVNTTLYFAGKHNLVPVTNNAFFPNLFKLKLKRAIQNPEYLNREEVRKQKEQVKLSFLSWEVFTEIVPNEALISKRIDQILKYKNAAAELQEKFRNRLLSLESMSHQEPWEESFAEEINKIVRLEIIPEIERIRGKRKVIWEKTFNEMIKTTASMKTLVPLFSIFFMPNMGYSDLLLYSTLAALWLSDMLPKLIDLRQEEREIRRNLLFFLLNFR